MVIRGSLLVNENKRFNLTCHTSNIPVNNIIWFKDGRPTLMTGKYYAEIAGLHNVGTYVCQVMFSNNITVASGAVLLQVESKISFSKCLYVAFET